MVGERQQEDQTQAATPRRLQRAREQGQVPFSREVQSLIGLAAVILLMMLMARSTAQHLANHLVTFLRNLDYPSLLDRSGQTAWFALASAAGPYLVASMLGACIAGLLQTGFLIHPVALLPTVSRINPIDGFHRLLSAENLTEAAKSLLKLAVMSAICWALLRRDFAGLMLVPQKDASALLPAAMTPVTHVMLTVLGVQALVAGLDAVLVRVRYAQRLRMSRHDMREEQRETEGDPRIKARVKQIRLLRARKRMIAAVSKATVVITNPTHYAIALAYDRDKSEAPRVVAKGVDSLAARVRETALAHHIPLVANPPLAQALYRVELDHEIPSQHYHAVAEIIAYVWRLKRSDSDMHGGA